MATHSSMQSPSSLFYEFSSYSSSPAVFRFQALPAELRNNVYVLVLVDGYSSVNNVVGKYARELQDGSADPLHRPTVVRHTPSILLVCRQIYSEAIPILRSHALVFEHGLLDFQLDALLSKDTLRNVRHLVLTDTGHNIMHDSLRHSFIGHKRLVTELTDWLRPHGHCIESLELHFLSKELKWHVENCWEQSSRCDMRQWLTSIFVNWREIRGIKKVDIFGWLPEEWKLELKRLMQAPVSPFVRLTVDILSTILDYSSLSFSSVSDSLNARTAPHVRRQNAPVVLPRLATPSILLVHKELSLFTLPFVRIKPLILDLHHAPTPHTSRALLNHISGTTLRTIRHIEIYVRHRAWLGLLAPLGLALGQGHSLVVFKLHLDDDKRASSSRPTSGSLSHLPRRNRKRANAIRNPTREDQASAGATAEAVERGYAGPRLRSHVLPPMRFTSHGLEGIYPDAELKLLLLPLRSLRSVKSVEFAGDLKSAEAAWYMDRLAIDMHKDPGEPSSPPRAIKRRRWG